MTVGPAEPTPVEETPFTSGPPAVEGETHPIEQTTALPELEATPSEPMAEPAIEPESEFSTQPYEEPAPALEEPPPPPPAEERRGYSEPARERPRHEPRQFRRAEPSSIAKAIAEVNEVIQSLTEALADMQDVLEALEEAEREKNADEREIESLRRALRNMQRPQEFQRRPPFQQRHQHHYHRPPNPNPSS